MLRRHSALSERQHLQPTSDGMCMLSNNSSSLLVDADVFLDAPKPLMVFFVQSVINSFEIEYLLSKLVYFNEKLIMWNEVIKSELFYSKFETVCLQS